jgi:hypothetical protein
MKNLRYFLQIIIFIFFHNFVIANSVFDFLATPQEQSQSKMQETDMDVAHFFESHTLDLSQNNLIKLESLTLIVINKITANSQTINVKVGQPVFFHNLEINLHKGFKSEDPYKNDSYGLLTLTEYKINDDAKILFHGWLIASSPSISTFISPIYEVFIKQCL